MATEAVIIQEPVSLVEKMATEAVIIQEPISIVEKMATEAVIIAEPIFMVKTEESKNLTLEVGASNNGVETANVVAEGNQGIAKGESFLMSPEISKVANETCGVLDHIEVDGTPFKAEKIPEDEEKMAVRMEDEAGTRGTEKGDTIDGSEELEKQASMDSHDPTVESLKGAKETVTEASSTEQVNEVDDTEPEKLPAEVGKDRIILDSLGEALTETLAESKEIACMDEKLEEVSSEEIKCTNGENDGIQDKNSVMKTEELRPQAELPVGNEHEKPHEFSGTQPEEQGNEAIGASEKKEEDSEDVSKACQSRDSTNPEHMFTEAAATIDLKSETSQMDEENVKEDSEDCTEETMNEKSEEENTAATMSIKEVSKEHETAAAGTVKENPDTKECPVTDISNSEISDETVKEIIKEAESKPMKSTEEVSNSNIEETGSIEETEKSDNDPSPFNVKDSKDEVIPIEVKEDHVHSSSVELEESGKNNEEETNVNEDEAEGEENEIHNVGTIEDIGVTTEHEGIGVNSANIDVNSTDSSVTYNENVEISEHQKDGMQDEIRNAGSEDHIELTNKEIQLKEVPGDEVKEHSTVPSEEYEATPSEERKITDGTSEKDQDLYEHLETVGEDVKVVLDTDEEPPVVMEVLDEMKRDEESTVIEAENVNLAWQSEEEKSKEEIPESYQQKNEPEKEKPVCPLNVVSEDVNTTTYGETVETSTHIEEATSIEDREERSEEEGREDSPTGRRQIEVNENTEIVKADISNKNADDVHVADSSIGQPVKNEHEKQHEFSDVQPEERGHEAIGAPKEKEENSEDVSDACQSRDVTNPEQTFPEVAATTTVLKSKTSEMENENLIFVKEVDLLDSKNFSESLEALDNKQEGIQQELEDCTADAMENIEEVCKGSETAASGTAKEEINLIEVKEELVHSSSFELEESEDNTEKESSGISTADLDCTSHVAETEETKIEEAETETDGEGERNEINNEGIGVGSVDIDVKSADSYITSEKDMEIPREEDGMQDRIPSRGGEDQMEMPAEEIQLKEVLGDEMKEPSIMPLEECDATLINETSEKDQPLYKHLENVGDDVKVVQATDEELAITKGSAEMRKDEEFVVSVPEGNIREVENIGFVQQNREGHSKEEIFDENFQQKDESEKKPASPLNVVYEDFNTAISGETAETSTNIEEATSINDREERSEGEKREETPTNHLQIEANDSYETVEVEISNETADDLHVTDSFIGEPVDNEHEKQNEFSDVQPVENEALENKEEEILKELEDCSAEKPEPKAAMENVEDNLKQEETNEVHEGPTLVVKEDCAITDDSLKSNEEDENEETPEVEVCEKLELDKTVEIAEKQILDEEDNNSQTTLTAQMMEEKSKEENTAAMVSITEASNSVIEEDHVCSSSFELEESKNDTEEEKPASCAAETEETNIKGAEAEEEKNERNNVVVVEEKGLEITQLEGIGVGSAEMNVKSPTEDTEIPREIDAMQDKVPNAGSEDQLEMNAEEIPSKEILGYEVKEYEPALTEEREISDETLEKDRELYENSEIPLSRATDEKLRQIEDSPKSDVPKAEPEDTGNESRHGVKEHLVEEPNVEVTNVSTEEVHSQQDNQTDVSEAKTLQDEISSDLGLKTEQTEDGKPLDEATDLGETAGACNDDEKVVKEENLAKNLEETENLKEGSKIGKEDQIPGVVIVNDNAKVEDYHSVSNECLNEAESKEQIVAENLEVEEDSANDGEASRVMKELEETRQDEESGDPVNVHSEDREAAKKTEEIIHDSKQFHEESCIEAVTEVGAETSLNNTGENSKALNINSVETNPEIVESDADQENLVEKVQLEEISSGLDPDVRTDDNDDVQKQNINVESLDKDEAQDQEMRIGNPVEKIEEEAQKDTEIEHEIQEDSSETKVIEEVCLSNEEQRELKAVTEEETIADQDPQNDEPEEQIQTASSTWPSEESEHGTGAISEEIKYGIIKEEVQTKLDAATGDEVTGEQSTIPPLVSREKDEENICTVEKTNETDMIPDKISEGFSVANTTTELCLEKEELLELDDAKMDDAEKEGEKTKEEETIKDEIEEDAKDAKTRLEMCSQMERSVELEAVEKDETTAVETLAEKISDEQVPNLTTAFPSKEDEGESIITAETIESEKTPDEDASLQRDGIREDEALAVDDDASSQVILTEKPDDLPDPVDTLPTDHLHPTTSTLPSEVQGDEKKEIELEEEESRENIPEQTQEIEETSDFNTEIQEKAFRNELLDETVAIQEKLVKARTEAGEIILDEVSAENVIVEAQKTSENEDLVEDKTVEAPGQASVARIESIAVIEENVVLAGFEEKPESESAQVAEDQSEETFTESIKSQDDETSIDVQNQETEEQMKEEPKNKLEDEHIINREQNTNETKAVILSEEVDTVVEKAEVSEGIKEYVMEKESSTNEIHPVLNGDEAINKVEDYSAVSTECIQVAKSEEQIQAENSEVEENSTNEKDGSKISNDVEPGKIDDIGPPNTVLEVKSEEQIHTSVCTLLSEDEEIRIENPVVKIEEETQKDNEIEHESQEESSETKTIEEVCLSNEEQRELKAVSEEETIADQDPQNDEPEEQIQTASSTLSSEESEHGTGAISEEIKYGITKEEVQTKLDAATGEEVTDEQTTSPSMVSRERDEENICTVEKTEEEKTNEVDMIPDKISEGLSVANTTTELCIEKEDLLGLDDAKKDDAGKEDEKTKEEETIKDEIEEDAKDAKTRLGICSQMERSVELEAVGKDETTAVETLAEQISDAQVLNLTTSLPSKEDECESTITAEMIESVKTRDEDASLQKDQLREDEALAVDDDASSQVILTEKPDVLPDPVDTLPTDHLHPTTSTLLSEVQGDEKKEIELEEEEESREKIPEQTHEIEEASDFNTEIQEKAFKNELLDETEDVAIQEKLVKARTEAGEIILDEVSAEKVIVEAQKNSENEDLVEDKTVEAPGQASVARIESTAVIEENVVLTGFEEKPESEPAPVAEDQSEETFPESSNSQDNETSIALQNQETEKQMNEETNDKLEDENIINRVQNTNETNILSEEVDKEVEKAEASEGIKEYDMEKESSTNEIHPVPNGNEAINEVEDYSAVSTECIHEAKSEEQMQAENSEVEVNSTNEKEGSPTMKELDEAEKGLIAVTGDELNKDHELGETKSEACKTSNADELGKTDDIGPPNTVLEVKPEEQIQTSVCTLLSEDEEIRIEIPVEKVEEETQKDTEIEHESQEDSSETKTIEEVCLSNEEKRELKAVSEEETIADQDPQNDGSEEQIQTASSTLPSEESERGTGAINKEIKYGITKEEVQTKLDDATGDEVTGEQTTSPPLVSRENDEENTCTVEKTEEEKIIEADMIPDKISEGFSVAETTELHLEKEELLELNDAKKDDDEKEGEKTKEEETIKDEVEEDAKQKTRLEICSQTERSVELEVVGEDEAAAVETLAEKISDAQVLNLTTALPSKEDENESTITAEMMESEKTPDEDASLQKDRLREDEALAVDDDPSSQVILTEKPDVLPDPVDTLPTDRLHPTTSTLPSEVQGDEKKEVELEEEEEESPEQTQEIEEASDFNTEIHEKAFKNELLDQTDVAFQEKLAKARTEAGEIILDEVPAEKVIVEAQKTSENGDLVEDKTVEAPGQASVASIESTAVIEENIVLAVAEDQSEETFPESSKCQDDETSIDVQNQETEEQIKDKLEDEHNVNIEQNTNETKAAILSEEVDKEVEKAEGNEGIKEYVMEKESSTNEIHPVPDGDEAINEVEDYSAVSAECIEEVKSGEQIQAENSEVEENSTNNNEGSPVTKELDEGKQDKESGDPVNVHSEGKEAEEKDEVIDDLKLGHDPSRNEAVTEERAETSLNDTEVNEELVNTLNISTVNTCLENSESDSSQETEEVEKVQLEEISSGLAPEVPTNNDDVEVNKSDADEFYMAKDKIAESESGLSVEKVDQLNQYEFVETKSEASKKSLTEELEVDKVEETEGVSDTSSDHTSQRVETNLKDDDSSTNTFPEEKSEEQLQSSTHTLLCEDEEITTARPIEKIENEIQNDASIIHESKEDSSCTKSVEEACLLNEEQRELKTVSEEETIADKSLPNDEPKAVLESETNTNHVIAKESEEHGAAEEKKMKEEEPFVHLPQSECTRELQGALEDGETAVHILPGEMSADNLHATASTLPSEVKENEPTETESKEDESPKKILEQTGEIEEASNLNKETCKKPFELLSETDAAANEIIAIDETGGEGNEITANEDSNEEGMEDKEVTEKSYSTSRSEEPTKDGYEEDELKEKIMEDETHEELKASEIEMIENQIKDKTIEDQGQGSVAKIETTAVTEENVAIAGFEEKPKSETEPVIEDQSNETIPENTKSQDNGTSLDVPDQETEEQIKEELKDKLEDEDSINREENTNEVTKGVILSEEVDKEVEKADGSDDIKENFMEKESSTSEIHPVSVVDEATNEVEDYGAVSTECIQEVESEEQIQAENSEVEENSTNDKGGSYITKELDERKQDEKSVDPVSVHSEDREAEEKAEIIDDLKLGHGESHSEVVTEERAETSLNDTEVNKEMVNTSNISSAKTSQENIGSVANQETEEVEKVQLEEISSDLAPEVPTNNNDEVEVIKRDSNEFYTAKDQNAESENGLTVQKVDQLNQDHELVETKSEPFKKSLTAELEANEVEETEAVPETFSDHTSQRFETILKDDDISTNTFPEEKPEAQLQSSTLTLFSEDEEIGTANPIEKIEEEIQNDAGIKHKIGEDSLDTKIIEEVLHQEDEALAEDNIDNTSAPNILSEKPEEQIQNPAVTLPSEEQKRETINEVDKTGEMKNGDSHGEEAVEEKSTEKDETREPEETLEGETNTCQVIPEESAEHGTVTEEKKIKEAESFEDEKSTQSECTRDLQGALEDGAAAVHILPGETSAVNLHPAASTLPSEVRGNETKETELQEDESLEKIQEQTREIEEVSNFNIETCGRASDNELLTETEDAAKEKKIVKTNEIAVIEVLKEEVMEDKEVTETSYSTSHVEEMIKDGSGEDELKDKLIQDNKLIAEAQKTSENEIIENQIEADHASISRIETIAVTEENVESAPPGFEEKPESDLEPVAEDQSKETLPEHTKSQDDETRTDVQNRETEVQIKEELKDKVEAEGSINGEQNKNEVTKAVILSEEVDGSEDIKEHVIEEESSTNELHPVSKGDETTNEVEHYSAVSIESIETAKSEEQIQARNLEDEENSTNNKEGSPVTKELDERRQDEESGDPENVHREDREAEEKVEIDDELKLNHDKSHSEVVTGERAETRLNDTEANEKLENTSNISSVKMSLETVESDTNQETKEVEKVQLEEVSSDLAPEVPTNNNEEAEVTESDPDVFYMSKDQIAEAENVPTAELGADKVEIKGVPEPLSDNAPPRVETILKVGSTSTNTFLEEKPEEQLESSACTLLSIPNEEQREVKAVSEEETIADKVLPNDESEEQIQTTSLTCPSVEREHGTGAISEEVEYGKTKEEVPINLDVVTGEETTGKQTHETNKPEEITSSPLVSMEKEENVSSVEQIEEEKLDDAEIPEKISENPFDEKKAAETCLENEAIKELDDAKKDTQALQMEESNEQFFTSELPVENLKHRTEAHDEEEVKEVEMLEKEGPQEPEAVIDQETVVARVSITEESQKIETISAVEMLDEEKRKEAVKVEEEKCEDSSAGETEELNEFHLVTKEETTSYLAFSEEQLHSFSASAITSEESEHETKDKKDEKTSEGDIIEYEIEEDASDAKATVEICSQKGSSIEVETVAEDEMTADEAEKIESKKIEDAEFLQNESGEDATLQKELLHGGEALVVENNASLQTIPKEKPEEQIPNLVVTLPSEEHMHNTISEVDKTEEEKIKEEEMKNGDSDGVKTVEEVSTEKHQTKEAVTVFEEDESLEKIREQTGEVEASSDINMEINGKGLNSELLDETEDAAIKENIGKAIDGSGGEANQHEKINEGNEIILNEVSKEEVASHSTSQSEEPTKDGEDALKNELIEDKTYKELIVKAQKTSENEITEKQIKDGVVMNPGQASVVRAETITVTEDHIENMGITSSVVEEYVLIHLQERVVECSRKAEVRDVKEAYPEVVEHGVEKTEDKSVEDSTKISSSDCVESFKETEDEKMGEVKIIKDETEEDESDTRTAVEICSQVDTSIKLEAVTENEMTSGQTLTAKKSEEQMQNPTSAPHSKEEQCVRASIAEEIESEKMEEEEFLHEDNEEDVTFQKEQLQWDEALAVENKASLQTIPTEKSEERIPNPVVTLSSEEHKHETINEFDKPEEENMKKEEVKNRDFDGGKTVEELSTEKDEIKGDAAMSEGEINHLHITASALPSDVQGDETNETESKENESPKKIPEQTGETEEASNFTPEIHEKASDNKTEDAASKENIVKASEGNEIILNEVSKEEIASYSTSHSEDPTKDASQEDAVKDERIEDKTYEELIVESQKPSENEMNEKQIEGGVVEEQVQASVVRIETTTESSTESSVAEGKQTLEYIQQTGETTKTASDMQIPRELDHIENTGITSLVAEEHVPVYLQDRVAGSSQKTEVGDIYPGGLECGGEKTSDCSGEEVTESILAQDSVKISSPDYVESFAKEASQVPQDMIEGDAKDETNVSRILQAEKSEKQSLAPVDAVVEEELKEVETRDKSTSDTKTGGEICLEKEENKEPKAVVVQETIVTQTKDPVSHFEDSSQEDEHAGDETNETFKIPTHEIQNEKPSVETQKDDANDNIRKETIAEDETVKDDMNEAPIVREEIPGKEDPIECIKTTNSTGKQQFLTEQQDEAFETSDKAVVGDLEPRTAQEICSEAGVASGKGEMTDNLGVEKPEEPESEDSAKLSLYDLLQRSTRETIQGTKNVIEERELKASNEEQPEEEAKTDEEVEDDENSKTESGTKPHKKSHNILSGMGSKVKHSISKMKKAITGKSSHSKESKPISPKESKK